VGVRQPGRRSRGPERERRIVASSANSAGSTATARPDGLLFPASPVIVDDEIFSQSRDSRSPRRPATNPKKTSPSGRSRR